LDGRKRCEIPAKNLKKNYNLPFKKTIR